MNRAKKLSALALLLLAFTVTGCGNEKEQDTDRNRAEAGASDAIGAGGSMGAEDNGEDAEAGGTVSPEGEKIFGHNKLDIYLTNLELGDEEGTAHLHMVNRTEDTAISISSDKVWMDGKEGEWQFDEGAITLAGGEELDVAVRFSKPESGDDAQKLSEYAYINVGAYCFEPSNEESGFSFSFYVKGDDDIAEAVRAELNKKPAVEAMVEDKELYNDNGVTISLTGIEVAEDGENTESEAGKDSIILTLDYSNSNSSLGCYQVYIGDTLIYDDAWKWENKVGVGCRRDGDTIWVTISGEGLYDQLSEEMEISIVCGMFNLESGEKDEYGKVLTPKLTIPVVFQ